MERLSLNEALMIMLADRDGVDGTNILDLYRKGQNEVITAYDVNPSGAGNFLAKMRSSDDIDNMLIWLTRNGAEDIFA
ncbi:hypothetical protein SEA_MORTYSMITH_47 [Microbacterium phage MortySmith]|nr:hypothetical protein SEA_AESIR_48 [Microbacterium phage Aesir]